MIAFDEAANLLLQARIKRKPINQLSDTCRPRDITEAYQCQNKLTTLMIEKFGARKVGYKVACTNTTAQSLLNVDGPFYGPLLFLLLFLKVQLNCAPMIM